MVSKHWSEDQYWRDAERRFSDLRRDGLSKLVLDLDAIEEEIFSEGSPAYRAMDALVSVSQSEGLDGHKGAPRLVLALSLLLSEMDKRRSKDANHADTGAEERADKYRHSLVLAVAWRLLTELFRRHATDHELRLIQTHPGTSRFGQLKLLINPRVGHIHTSTQLVLNLRGETGTYEVFANGFESSHGDFLTPALSGDLGAVLDRVEAAIGLRAPAQLPPSTPAVLAMRTTAELLATSWLDRQVYGIETAWFDWSGGVRVQQWATHFGVAVGTLQAGLDSGHLGWEEVFLEVSHLFRVVAQKDGDLSGRSLVVDMKEGVITSFDGGKLRKSLALLPAYKQNGGRLEPLAAELLIELRR